MEDYSPNNEDELLLSKGDAVQVVAVVLDGWWKVKKGNKVGYAPASILRKKGMDELTRVCLSVCLSVRLSFSLSMFV